MFDHYLVCGTRETDISAKCWEPVVGGAVGYMYLGERRELVSGSVVQSLEAMLVGCMVRFSYLCAVLNVSFGLPRKRVSLPTRMLASASAFINVYVDWAILVAVHGFGEIGQDSVRKGTYDDQTVNWRYLLLEIDQVNLIVCCG